LASWQSAGTQISGTLREPAFSVQVIVSIALKSSGSGLGARRESHRATGDGWPTDALEHFYIEIFFGAPFFSGRFTPEPAALALMGLDCWAIGKEEIRFCIRGRCISEKLSRLSPL
jgi:hypothetical protein